MPDLDIKEPTMIRVYAPESMNETFARAFNARVLDDLLLLYEPEAVLVDGTGARGTGREEIRPLLFRLLQAPGVLVSRNNFCIVHGDTALLRADFMLRDGEVLIASGSTAELIRRQPDASWLYVIDHAAGASLPALDFRA